MRATAEAHPNVALIKYWGKSDPDTNLPATDSLSVTLGGIRSRTTVEFREGLTEDRVLLDGREQAEATGRVKRCLDLLRARARVPHGAIVHSENDFPTGAGLASSASGYAALAVAADAALGLGCDHATLEQVARIGSGSAPRSLYGGFVLLRRRDDGTACEQLLASDEWPVSVVVAITSLGEKAIGSREGMTISRDTSPFYSGWIDTHPTDIQAARDCIRHRDFMGLAEHAEHSCLKMHAVMMTSRPPLLYWSATTLACLHAIRQLRGRGVPVFFTVDAGPQVKAVCLSDVAERVAQELAGIGGVIRVQSSPLGQGARVTGD